MLNRICFGAFLLAGLVVPLTGCANSEVDSIQINPATQALTVGQTAQLSATGSYGHGSNHPATTQNVTSQVSWTSSAAGIATVSSSGLVTAVSTGNATITASMPGFTGNVSGTGTVNVTASTAGGAAGESLISIAVLPGSITVNNLNGTGQFLAYGTFSTPPTVMDITNGINHNGFVSPVTWVSSAQTIFPINSSGASGSTGGLVTAAGSGTDNIYAVAANPDGTLVYSPTVTFNCPYVAYVPATGTTPATLGSCNQETIASGLLVTLTVFNAGLNTSNWLVTAPSATGTPDVIHCGPGSVGAGFGPSVCSASYPLGTSVVLTAPAQSGVSFGGWSWNCPPTVAVNAAGPNTCSIPLGTANTSNESVGAIFN